MDWLAYDLWMTRRELLAAETRDQYLQRGKQADAWLRPQGRRVEWAVTAELAAWMDSLPPTPASRSHARRALVKLGDHLTETGRRRDNPAASLPTVREPKGLPRPCPEPARLLSAARSVGPRAEMFVALLFYGGLRFNEARRLRWTDIRGDWLEFAAKGGGRRSVPINARLAAAIARYRLHRTHPEFLFPSPVFPDRPISETVVRRWWQQVTEVAGLEGVTPHQCRHRFGTDLLAMTRDLAATQDAMGHRSPATTRIYAQVESPQVARAVGLLDYEGGAR